MNRNIMEWGFSFCINVFINVIVDGRVLFWILRLDVGVVLCIEMEVFVDS